MLKQVILHIDISQFFVSVERLTHPEYNGKIVICGPDAPRSVVCSADYIARKEYGIKAGMPIWKVKQLLGQAVNNTIFTEVHFEEYQKYSFKFKNIIKQFGPVESFGLDECFVDVTKYLQNQSNFTELNEIEQREQAILVAEHIKALIKQQIQLDVSIGISDQK
ncbi:hypothetical protein FACS1894166_13420 [Bacilli bacterium]|nr:hypothetical protein FACS1894166_13420 [Bacilli bacterium]